MMNEKEREEAICFFFNKLQEELDIKMLYRVWGLMVDAMYNGENHIIIEEQLPQSCLL
jgi:hypothetical protein